MQPQPQQVVPVQQVQYVSPTGVPVQQVQSVNAAGVPVQQQQAQIQIQPQTQVQLTQQMQMQPQMSASLSGSAAEIVPSPEPIVVEPPKNNINIRKLYSGLLLQRGVDPKEKNKKYGQSNLLISIQLDIVKGKTAYWGRLGKDFHFFMNCNHSVLSCVYADKYHPLGRMNRILIFYLELYLNFAVMYGNGGGEEQNYRFGQSLGIAAILWFYNALVTWILTGECTVGATKCKRRCFKCLACCLCGWNRLAKFVFCIFFGLWIIVGLIVLTFFNSDYGTKFFVNFMSSLLLDYFIVTPILSFLVFYWGYRKQMKGVDWNKCKRNKNQIVTVHDFIAWKRGMPLPAPTPAFQKFQSKFSIASVQSVSVGSSAGN